MKPTDGNPQEINRSSPQPGLEGFSLEQYRQLVENSLGLICVHDLEGRVQLINPAAAHRLGYQPGDMMGRSLEEFLPPSARRQFAEYLRRIAREPAVSGQIELLTREGRKRIWMYRNARYDEAGKPPYVLAHALDITEHKRAEKALRELQKDLERRVRQRTAELEKATAYLNALIEHSPVGIVVFDSQNRVELCNPAFERMFQYTREEIIGRDLAEWLAPQERPSEPKEFYQRGLAGEVVHVTTHRRRKDGTHIEVELYGGPFLVDGQQRGSFVLYRDITEQRALEAQLRQAQKMDAVGRLAGGVAHDFNNLLVGLLGYTELLLANLDPAHPAQDWAEKILAAAERAASLTGQLLAFSRKQVLAPKVMNLNETVAETEKMLRRLIGEDIELSSELDPSLANVKADPAQLAQVLLNLAVNARDAMPRGGQLRLKTANLELPRALATRHDLVPVGRYVLLAVSDSGAGMDEEVLEHLFEPFFTTKQQGKGTGLGLAMVYGVVKQSGGYVVVESQRNLGTRFMIYLPRVEEAVEEPPAVPVNPSPPLGWETILLAEDDQGVLEPVRQHLEMAGYKVLAARTPAEAAALAQRYAKPIDLLLTDVVMPGMSGPELAERVGRLRPHTRVLYMSGYAGDTLLNHGVPQKNTVFLQKPFRSEVLVEAVRRALAAARADSSSPTSP